MELDKSQLAELYAEVRRIEHQRFERKLGASISRIDGGYRIKETATHYIDVMEMIFNWRIVTTPIACPMVYDRGWCYQGIGLAGFLPAALAALAWDGSDDTEPAGYFKRTGA